jgi:hypothetical protein
MNIWVEYWEKSKKISRNTHAQVRELDKWIEPDPKKINKRFCQNMEEAQCFAKAMVEQGNHIRIKQDGNN